MWPGLSFAACPTNPADCPAPAYSKLLIGNTTGGFEAAGSVNAHTYWIDGVQLGAGGGGLVNVTGSPVAGNLTLFSGPTSITSGNLSGDCATSGTLTITCTNLSHVTNASLQNSGLAHSTMTINGTVCTLGVSCNPIFSGSLAVGSTAITSGTSGRILFDNAGVLGEKAVSGTGNVVLSASSSISNLTVTGSLTATGLVTNADLVSPSITINGSTCTLGGSCTPIAGGLVVGSTAIGGGTTTRVLFDNAGVLGEYTVSGTGNVALTTSPTFTTPALGTPSAVNLSNATNLPCAAMPALTGGVTSSAGSCATTAASVPTSAITGNVTNEKCLTWDSTLAVTAQTMDVPVEWTTYTITEMWSKVAGGGSFTADLKIGGTNVTSCNGVTVSGTSNTVTTCTAANTGVKHDIVSFVASSPSGTVNQAYVCAIFTHTVN